MLVSLLPLQVRSCSLDTWPLDQVELLALCFNLLQPLHPPLQVRSCSLDTWLPEQVEFMARTGNALANTYWEGGLREGQKPRSFSSLTDLEAFLRRKYVAKDFAAGTWPPPPEALADGPEVRAVLAECLPADRAAELRAATEAAANATAAAAAAEAEEQARQEAAKRAAAAAVNLMDFDAEPAEPAVVGNDALALAVVDPMRSLEEVFAAPAADESHGGAMVPWQPASSLGSWDMGAAIAQQQAEAERQRAEAEAAATAAATAAQPPRPAPYCPPWAPQPGAQPTYSLSPGSMQVVPAGDAFAHAFRSTPAMPSAHSSTSSLSSWGPAGAAQPAYPQQQWGAQQAYQAQHSGLAAYGSSASSPSLQLHGSLTSSVTSSSSRPRAADRPLVPRPPATHAEAKALEAMANQLGAFNLHAEVVSALKPSPRLASPPQQVVPLVARTGSASSR
jgi:hypothetical protein